MVQDMYTPNIMQPSRADKISDKWHGTNIVADKNMRNNMELQKAVNINKYNWNKEGMIQAGINPLVASGSLGSMSNSQAQSNYSSDIGVLGDLIDMYNPIEIMKETKELVKDLLKAAVGNGNVTKKLFG